MSKISPTDAGNLGPARERDKRIGLKFCFAKIIALTMLEA
jgi:hypothetical protein